MKDVIFSKIILWQGKPVHGKILFQKENITLPDFQSLVNKKEFIDLKNSVEVFY